MTVYLERGYNRREYPWVPNSIIILAKEFFCMIYVGIDVAKDKHDCFITNSNGEVLFKHYNVTLSHAAKKLVRLIFAMEKSGKTYIPAA